jgi:serine/threonine protein kinase
MTSQQWAKVKSLFLEAVAAAPERRQALLREHCGGDEEVRREVEAMLANHRDTPEDADETADTAVGQSLGLAGRYKLLQKIGEGGMGIVFMAEQQSPVRRTVALKLIKPGMDSAAVLARFEAERQALAMMEHPNIARVYDAGAADNGRPFFVMELVQGVPITQYCDDRHLTLRERLELFVPVCHAIQHAHQKGIIHRDLKPGNVLVMIVDGHPVPKVIDFGVAKALHQKLTEKTLFTQFGNVVGTLEYMSPEQTDLDVTGADTRSDIYSLGVLLYELLTGATPLDRTKLREVGYVRMLRSIREVEPPKPSTRLAAAGASIASVSALRKTEPGRLVRMVSGDLDWIVMKCLEKERSRRYETANALAADVDRHLLGDAVLAAPPSRIYRARKFVRRNRGPVSAAALVGVALLLGVIGTGLGFLRESRAKVNESRRADSERYAKFVAENRLAQLNMANDTLWTIFDNPRDSLGKLYLSRGYFEDAEPLLLESLKLQRDVAGLDDLRTRTAIRDMGMLYYGRQSYEAAEPFLREVSDWNAAHPAPDSTAQREAETGFYSLASCYRRMHQHDKAIAWEKRLAVNLNAELAASSAQLDKIGAGGTASNRASLLFSRARLNQRLGRFADARADFSESLRLNPTNQDAWTSLAYLQLFSGDLEGYRASCGELLRRFGDTTDPSVGERAAKACLLGSGSDDLKLLMRLGDLVVAPRDRASAAWDVRVRLKWYPSYPMTKGMAEYRSGNNRGAVEWLTLSREGFTEMLATGMERDSFVIDESQATAGFFLAMAEYRLGHHPQARQALASARAQLETEVPAPSSGSVKLGFGDWLIVHIAEREAAAVVEGNLPTTMPDGPARPTTSTSPETAVTNAMIARREAEEILVVKALEATTRAGEAEALAAAETACRETVESCEKRLSGLPGNVLYQTELGHSLWRLSEVQTKLHRTNEAESSLRRALKIFELLKGQFPNGLSYLGDEARTNRRLGDLLLATGRSADALESYRRTRDLYMTIAAYSPQYSFYYEEYSAAFAQYAQALADAGQTSAAESNFREALRFLPAVASKDPSRVSVPWGLSDASRGLARLLRQLGRVSEADAVCRSQLEFLVQRSKLADSDAKLTVPDRAARARAYHDQARELLTAQVHDGLHSIQTIHEFAIYLTKVADSQNMNAAWAKELAEPANILGPSTSSPATSPTDGVRQ